MRRATNAARASAIVAARSLAVTQRSYVQVSNFVLGIGEKDTTTKRMLEGILAMEEEHADDLVGMLADLKK